MRTLLITRDGIGRLVQHVGLDVLMDRMVLELTRALEQFDPAATRTPRRDGFSYSQPAVGLLEWMPVLAERGRASVKVVGYHPDNPDAHGLPTILSTITVFDTATGHLTGLVDGTFLTALRTGAASAVASRVLARPESATLGLIGCGAQAVAQLHALSRLFPLRDVLLHDSDSTAVESFPRRVERLRLRGIELRPSPPREILRRADIISTATTVLPGAGPVFEDTGNVPWLHINAVGSDFPGKTEVPASLLERSLVSPDFAPQAIDEGECQQLDPERIGPSLDAVVRDAARHHAFRETTTVFDSTGWALEDHIAVHMLFDFARELEIGTFVELESVAADPRDPYGFAAGSLAAEGSGRVPATIEVRACSPR